MGSSTVVFNGSGAIVKGLTYNNLVLSPSSSTNYSNDGPVVVGGNLTIGSSVSQFDISQGLLTVTGNISVEGKLGAPISTATKASLLLAGNNQTVGGSGSIIVTDLTLVGTGTTVITTPGVVITDNATYVGGIHISPSSTLSLGAINLTLGCYNAISTYGKISGSGTFEPGLSTVYHDSKVGTAVSTKTYNNLVVSVGSVVSGTGSLTCRGNLTVGGAGLNLGNFMLSVGGNVSLNSSLVAVDTMILRGTASTLEGSGSFNVGRLVLTQTGASNVVTASGVLGTLLVDLGGGSLSLGSNTLNLTGAGAPFMLTLATFYPGTSTIQYSGPGYLNILTGIDYFNLQAAGTGQYQITAPVSLSGSFIGSSGTLVAGGTNLTMKGANQTFSVASSARASIYNLVIMAPTTLSGTALSVGGTITNSSTLYASQGSRLTLSSTANQTIGGSGVTRFYDLILSNGGTANTVSLNGTTVVENSLVVGVSQTLSIGTSALTLEGTGNPVTANGSINGSNGAIAFVASSGSVSLPALTVSHLKIGGGSSVVYSASGDISCAGDFSVGPSTLTVGGNVTVGGGVNVTGGFTSNAASSLSLYGVGKSVQIDASSAFGNLVLGNSASYTLAGNGIIQVGGTLTVGSGGTLSMGSSVIRLTGSGAPFVNDGTLVVGASTVQYAHPTGVTVSSVPYFNLKLDAPTISDNPSYANAAQVTIAGDLGLGVNTTFALSNTIYCGGSVTLASSAILSAQPNSVLVLTGSEKVAGGGTFNSQSIVIASGARYTLMGAVNIGGSGTPLVVDGTLVPGGSTLVFTGSGVTLAPVTYNHLTVNKANQTFRSSGNFNVNGDLVLGNSTTLDLASLRITLGGGITTNSGVLTASPESTLVMIGTSKNLDITNGTARFGSVVITGSYSPVVTVGNPWVVMGNLELKTGAQLSAGAISMVVGGDLISQGTFSLSTTGFLGLTGSGKSWGGTSTSSFGGVRVLGSYVLTTNIVAEAVAVVGSLNTAGFSISKSAGGTVTVTTTNVFVWLTEHGAQSTGSETANVPFAVTLAVQDGSGNTVSSYTGVHNVTLKVLDYVSLQQTTLLTVPSNLTLNAVNTLTFTNGLTVLTGIKILKDSGTPPPGAAGQAVYLLAYDDSGIVGTSRYLSVQPGQSITPAAGGTLSTAENLKIEIPADAIPASIGSSAIVAVSTPSASSLTVAAGGFELTSLTLITVKEIVFRDPTTNAILDAGTFSKPVALEIPYTLPLPTGVTEDNLRIYRYDKTAQRWRLAEGTQTIDKTKKVVKTSVTRFSIFGVLPAAVAANFDTARAFPSPFKPATAVGGTLKFQNLPIDAVVKIYSVDGNLVKTINESDAAFGNSGWVTWDGTNEQAEPVVGGVYFYVITSTSASGKKSGKFVLLR